MRKLRIAVWHNLPSGGGKRQLYYHVKGLVERGHYIESWCPDTADQRFLPLNDLVREHVIPLRGFRENYRATIRPLGESSALIRILEQHCRSCAEQINAGGFDVLYANACAFLSTTAIAQYVTLPSALYLGEPYRWFYEAMPELAWITPMPVEKLSLRSIKRFVRNIRRFSGINKQAIAERAYARAFDRILVNSVFSRETVLRTYNLESSVCYLGIDTEQYRPTGEPKEKFVVGLGTIHHAKGVDRAIRALGTVEKSRRPSLIWIGNGADPAELRDYRRLAESLQVDFTSKMHISDAEVVSLLSRAVAMIYTSRLEPFGLAPLEANACGTAVVAIAEGGVKESMSDGVSGFLVDEDDPIVLGERIEQLVTSPQLARELGLKAREYVLAEWSLDRATEAIESKLQQLLAQVQPKRAIQPASARSVGAND